MQAQGLFQSGRLAEARALCMQLVSNAPATVDALFLLGLIEYQTGQLAEAIRWLQAGAQRSPRYPQLKTLLGAALAQSGALDDALAVLMDAVAVDPSDLGALTNLGLIYANRNRMSEAVGVFKRALKLSPNDPGLLANLGNAHHVLEQRSEAEATFRQAIRLAPDYAPAVAGLGAALCQQERFEEALAVLQPLTQKFPEYAGGWCNLGIAQQGLRQCVAAQTSIERALALVPAMPEALNSLGLILAAQKKFNEAMAAYQRVLEIHPVNVDALNNLGLLYKELKQYPLAFACFDQAIQLRPNDAKQLSNRGLTSYEAGAYEDARQYLAAAFASDPKLHFVFDSLLLAQSKLCDWSMDSAVTDDFLARMERGNVRSTPLPLLAIASTKAQQQAAASGVSEKLQVPVSQQLPPVDAPATHERLRIAYLSADFHEHATAYLMAELFETHDRTRFEIIGLCHGHYAEQPVDGVRQRIRDAFDQFHEVTDLSDEQVAALIRKLGVDVLVDLKGHTKDSRIGILAYRPAPVQMHYLGYPGTLGASFIDYLVADPVLVPEDHRPFYTEKIIYLPDTYQVNDAKRVIAEKVFTRAELGLPETGFVFCCFNNNYKITPDAFDSWMHILLAVPESVLWLYQDNPLAAENLRKEAAARGVDPARLVFATKMPLAEHLARHRAADLFLDTFYYGAHTTASDALWAGLPLLTKLGDTYASRVAGSLLTALGVSELITTNVADYEAMAVTLARSPERLALLREAITQNRLRAPLFDTQRFVRHLECAYELSNERHRAGLPPEHIVVEAQ